MARRKSKKRKIVKIVFAMLSLVCFFLMLGTVGAIETDTIPLLKGAVSSFMYLGLFAIFAYLGGAFYDQSV